MMADPKFSNVLDIFMMLNKNNDGFIEYDETQRLMKVILSLPNQEDRGIVQSE